MAKFKFHKLAALAVLIASAAWVATGEFSSVGSAAIGQEEGGTKPEAKPAVVATPVLKTVAVVNPPFIQHARTIRVSGLTKADKSATLAVRTGGIIAKLPVAQGQRVKEGDLILALDTEGKGAAVESARASLDQREKEYEASERLAKRGSLPKLQLDTARSALAAARSALEKAEAELGQVEVRAPFSGIIDTVSVEQGSSVQQGAPIATLLQLDPVIAIGEVSERDLVHMVIGGKAEVRLVSGLTAQGTVRYISRQANAATRTFAVEIAIPNPDAAIPSGMTAEITLSTEPVQAVMLPRSVVTLSDKGDLGIRIAKADNTVDFVPIDLIDDTTRGLVLGGVPSDARIIVAGQDLVTDGEKVNAVEADEAMLRRLAGTVAD